jgi:FKBP-type peptidyl-prolyl cis-trans isomerase FkpA
MKQALFLFAAASLILTGCMQSFKKEKGGIEYKIISDGKGKQLAKGSFFEIQFDQVYKGPNKDTVLFTSADYTNQIVSLDSAAIPPVYYKIFSQARKGDSIIVKTLTDSIMKETPGQTPPFMKKGAHIIAHYKIVNVYETKELAQDAYKTLMDGMKAKDSIKSAEQLKKDDKTIADYLAKNNITATKAPLGTYVQVLAPGEGDAIDSSKVLKVMYTGRLMDGGKAFDSNTDAQFGHLDPLPVYMNAPEGSGRSVIKGWTDGLSILKKGGKAKLYIPSSLGYGARGNGNEIKPNANLVFDVEVVDVITEKQAMVEEEAQQKKMMAEQKRLMDSLQKAKKDTVKGKK